MKAYADIPLPLLVWRRETPAGNAASWEHFVTLGGQRGLTLAETGATDRPSRLYESGPLGEVLFERTLSTAAATAGVQLDVELPLADHQLTTRAVLDGDDAGASALRVRQSVDYAPLGRVVRLRDGAGQPLVDGAGAPNLAALDVALASFHGQESDPRTGLVKMGARWYSPQTGRFTSEDPIGEGTNWYEFADNDPVNFSDPTGLSQAGHPLAGGYSGGVTTASRIPTGAPTFSYNSLFAPTPGPTRAASTFSRSTAISTPSYAFPSGSSLLGPTSALLAPATGGPYSLLATPSFATATSYVPTPNPGPATSFTQVMNGYSRQYANDSAFRNAADEQHANRNALQQVQYGTPVQRVLARGAMMLNDVAGAIQSSYVLPGYDELQDARAVGDRNTSFTQRTAALGSLLLNVLTAGQAPNATAATRTVQYSTHTADELLDLRRFTGQIDVLPNSQVLTQLESLQSASAQLGKQGEKLASQITGATKNTQKYLVGGQVVIPDQVLASSIASRLPSHVVEVKNVLYQAYTKQLRTLEKLVGKSGNVNVFLPPQSKASGPLRDAFKNPNSPLQRSDLVPRQ